MIAVKGSFIWKECTFASVFVWISLSSVSLPVNISFNII